jgi:uncharacterized membrane protein YbhN (UPF0104 family)
VFTIGTLIVTPGGIGGIEAAFYFLFQPVVPENLLALTLLGWRMLTCYLQLTVGAVVFMIMNRGQGDKPKLHENRSSDLNVVAAVEPSA